jgi:hypothetical protein
MASKRGPLSKAETFYIEEHVKMGQDITTIATDLDRPAKSIEKCVAKAQKENAPKGLTASDQFIRKNGAVIMTENASTISDARRKSTANKRSTSCVIKIKDD